MAAASIGTVSGAASRSDGAGLHFFGVVEAMVSPTEWARIAPRLEAKRAAGERQTVRGTGPAGVTGRLNIRLEKHPWQTSMWSR